MMIQMTKMRSLLTSILNIHLNIGQNLTINTPEVYMSLETLTVEALPNKQIQHIGNAQIHVPANFMANVDRNSTISIRVCPFW